MNSMGSVQESDHDFVANMDPLEQLAKLRKEDKHCDECGCSTQHLIIGSIVFCGVCNDRIALEQEELDNRLVQEKRERKISSIADMSGFRQEIWDKAKSEAPEQFKRYAKNREDMLKKGVNILFMGSVGTGKTTLAVGILNWAIRAGYYAEYAKGEEIVSNYKMFKDCKLLVIDEIHRAVRMYGDKPASEDRTAFYNLVEHRKNKRLPTIFISNENRKYSAVSLGEATVDRMVDRAVIVVMDGESHRKSYDF